MPIARKNDIPQDFLNQMKSNLTKEPSTPVETVPAAKVSIVNTPVKASEPVEVKEEIKIQVSTPATEDKKEKYADVMNVRLSKGRRNEIKTFCTSCGISVTQYIETSFEYLAKEVAAGRLVISKGGITRKEI